MTRFNSSDDIMRYIVWVNTRLGSIDTKVRDAAVQKAAKGACRPLFLTSDPDGSWMDDEQMMEEYVCRVPMNEQNAVDPSNAMLRPKRRKIPAAVRNACWVGTFGTALEGVCTVCKIVPITKLDFHAGHIIPHVKGGPDSVGNLQPVCATCNTSMGSQYLATYAATHFPSGE